MTQTPAEDSAETWSYQCHLIQLAEKWFGSRDETYTICQPRFSDVGPIIRVWPNTREVLAELSQNATNAWPIFVFELAHESVHMLNPIQGYTNLLEEGVATYFQFHVTPILTKVTIPITVPAYIEAKFAIEELQSDVPKLARNIRDKCGGLGKATVEVLTCLCPNASTDLLVRLVATYAPR